MTNQSNRRLTLSAIVFSLLSLHPLGAKAKDQPAEDKATVSKLVDQLASDDPVDRERAGVMLEDRPDVDLPLIESAAAQDDLRPEQKARLNRLLVRMRPRVKLRKKNADDSAIIFAWRSKSAAAHYERSGHKNPLWDDSARKAIQLWGQIASPDSVKRDSDLHAALDQALAAGCDDADVLAIAGLYANDTGVNPDKVFSLFRSGLDSAEKRTVSPQGAATIYGRVLRGRAAGLDGGIDYKNFNPTAVLFSHMVQNCLDDANTPGVPLEHILSSADNVINTGHTIHVQLKPFFDHLYPLLEKMNANDARVLTIKGQFYIYYAWEARGDGFADSVTPQGWKDFADRLAVANEALTQAWKSDPGNPNPPTKMLTVALGQEWPVEEVKKWYQRAMDANPDNHEACVSMLYYLQPKWHGSTDEMLQFGRDCFETRNWHGNIAFMLLDAHQSVAKLSANEALYYQSESVWSDVSTVYSAYLDAYPDEQEVRSKFARWACLCAHWKDADKLFKELGDKADESVFGGNAKLQGLKKRAADEAGK